MMIGLRLRWCIAVPLGLLFSPATWAGDGTALRTTACRLVPTFMSAGAYFAIEGPVAGASAELTFRRAGEKQWQAALAPVIDGDWREIRGSILSLRPATDYEVRLRLLRNGAVIDERTAIVRTWSDDVPVAREIVLPAGVSAGPLVITAQGTPEGWVRYRAAPEGSTVDAGTAAPHAVLLDHAAYVVVEGLAVRGGTEDAVKILDSHDVRVRGCDISGWGDPGRWGYYSDKKHQQWAFLDAAGRMIDHQAGIRVRGGRSTRVVIGRNLIHDPRGTANTWEFKHPHGPEGVVLSETGGNIVVRNNDMFAGDGHRWNDVIASEYNGEVTGGPHRDTDIHGNLLADANDDGIELDGGQINVRAWHNWIEGGYCGVSCAPNLRGPSYVFRNQIVTEDGRGRSGAGFKMGGDPGLSFLLNNTVYSGRFGLSSGHYGKNPSLIYSRNNLYAGPPPRFGQVRYDWSVSGDLDHDLIPPGGLVGTDKPRAGREAGAVFARAEFVSLVTRDLRLKPGSPGTAAGVMIPNEAVAGEDIGAFASSDAPIAWPPRPGAPVIFPARVQVRVAAGAEATVTLSITFARPDVAWKTMTGESWLQCSASARGGMQALVCRVDARKLAPGLHRTFVSVRTADGHLRSVPFVVGVDG